MTSQNSGIAFFDGKYSPIEDCKISISDRGFLFGHSVFETVLVANGKIVGWDMHFSRLSNSCKRSFIAVPEEYLLRKHVETIVEKNIEICGFTNPKMSLRIIVTGGNSFDLPIRKVEGQLPKSNIFMVCRNIPGPSPQQYENGIRLKSLLDYRPKELIDVKSCNYLLNIMALEEANEQGYEDVLFYDKSGVFTESTTANFIWFDNDYQIYSISLQNNCLPGTTLLMLIEALEAKGKSIKWEGLRREDLSLAYGAAILSSTRLVLPIREIDSKKFEIEQQKDFFQELNNLLTPVNY